jgi:hypothetical protein
MPVAIKGCGTGLVAASRKRKHDGQTQFDAIEAGMIFYFPFLPYKAMHVIETPPVKANGYREHYQFVPLRMSARLIARAFMNRWGNILGMVAPAALFGFCCSMANMDRPFMQRDRENLAILVIMLLVGVACKLAWLVLTQKDEKIKDLLGFHANGSSDPWDWLPDQAEAATRAMTQEETSSSLVEVARRAIQAGNRSKAAFCIRLAMRNPNDFEAQDMMDRLLASS